MTVLLCPCHRFTSEKGRGELWPTNDQLPLLSLQPPPSPLHLHYPDTLDILWRHGILPDTTTIFSGNSASGLKPMPSRSVPDRTHSCNLTAAERGIGIGIGPEADSETKADGRDGPDHLSVRPCHSVRTESRRFSRRRRLIRIYTNSYSQTLEHGGELIRRVRSVFLKHEPYMVIGQPA